MFDFIRDKWKKIVGVILVLMGMFFFGTINFIPAGICLFIGLLFLLIDV